VANAGGPSRFARSSSDFKIISPSGKLKPNRGGLSIQPGDTIVVPERSFSRAEIVQMVIGATALAISTGVLVFTLVKK
jgi:hypothetical protein